MLTFPLFLAVPPRRHGPELVEIGARLRARREELGLLQADVVRETGIAQTRLSRVEGGGSAFDLIDLALILQLYGLTFEELLRPFDDAERGRINQARTRAQKGAAELGLDRVQRRRAKAVEEARARLNGPPPGGRRT